MPLHNFSMSSFDHRSSSGQYYQDPNQRPYENPSNSSSAEFSNVTPDITQSHSIESGTWNPVSTFDTGYYPNPEQFSSDPGAMDTTPIRDFPQTSTSEFTPHTPTQYISPDQYAEPQAQTWVSPAGQATPRAHYMEPQREVQTQWSASMETLDVSQAASDWNTLGDPIQMDRSMLLANPINSFSHSTVSIARRTLCKFLLTLMSLCII